MPELRLGFWSGLLAYAGTLLGIGLVSFLIAWLTAWPVAPVYFVAAGLAFLAAAAGWFWWLLEIGDLGALQETGLGWIARAILAVCGVVFLLLAWGFRHDAWTLR